MCAVRIALQTHYAVLLAPALEEDDLPEIKDETVPDEEGLSRSGVVNAIEEFKLSVYGDKYEESDNPGHKKVEGFDGSGVKVLPDYTRSARLWEERGFDQEDID
ncbi:hypothetical protein NL676_027122 [Syzygium grande]|nr:hypothetical protein NL676_027122 [Syzygium grande]